MCTAMALRLGIHPAVQLLLLFTLLAGCSSEQQQPKQHRFAITFKEGTNALEQFQSMVLECKDQQLASTLRRGAIDKWYGRRIFLRYEYISNAQMFWDSIPRIQNMYKGTDILASIEEDYLLGPSSSAPHQWAMDKEETHSMYEWYNPALENIVQETGNQGITVVVSILDTGVSETDLQVHCLVILCFAR